MERSRHRTDPNGPTLPDGAIERLIRRAGTRPDGFLGLPPRRILRALGLPSSRYELRDRTWVRRDDRGAVSTALRIKRRELLLLTPAVGTVRIWLEPRADARFLADARRLRASVPGPAPDASHDGHVSRSAWWPGGTLDTVPPAARVTAVRSLLRAQVDASRATHTDDPVDLLRIALRTGAQHAEHGPLFRDLLAHPWTARLAGLPLALQHGDPAGGNVIVAPDGRAALIDWSPFTLGRRPFWSDAALLVGLDGHRPLLEGAFDDELAALWRAVGLAPPEADDLRRLMAFGGVLFFTTISLAVDEDDHVISRTTGLPPTRLSKPCKVARAFAALPPSVAEAAAAVTTEGRISRSG